MAIVPFPPRETEGGRSGRLRSMWRSLFPGAEPAAGPGPLPPPPPPPRVPSRWAQHYAQVRRDTRMVLEGLRGEHPPPLLEVSRRWPDMPPPPSAAGRGRRDAVQDGARVLEVSEVRRETPDAVSVLLREPGGVPLTFVPGQFLTLLLEVDGQPLRRAYSIASPPSQRDGVRIAIKRVPGGRASNHLCDTLCEGQTVRVLGPSGQFTCAPDPEASRHVVLLGGGSGITPLLSIAQAVLEAEPRSRVSLLYGNRGPDHVMFDETLARMAEREPGRFTLQHVFSDPPDGHEGPTGMLDVETAGPWLDSLGEEDIPRSFYLCGPVPMRAACRETLLDRGIDPSRIHEESFVAAATPPVAAEPSLEGSVMVRVEGAGEARELEVFAGQTLLEAGLAAGLPMPFSCAMGGCGACRVRLHEGHVDMAEPSCLTTEERSRGYVLACVGRPRSACRIEVE